MRPDSNQFLIFSGRVEHDVLEFKYRMIIYLHGIGYSQGGYDIFIENGSAKMTGT